MNRDEYIARLSELVPAENIAKLCLLNEEAIGVENLQPITTDDYDSSYCPTCNMCFFDDDPENDCECTSRNRTKQELKQIIGVSND